MVSPSTVPRTSATPRSGQAARARKSRQSVVRALRPNSREATCGFRPAAGLAHVGFLRSSSGDITVDGCHACGSVWTCPRCAARITESRCADLQAATVAWIAAGNSVAMVTLTFPHGALEGLSDLSLRMRDAMTRLRAASSFKAATRKCVGFVRATEITWGEANGWHPHFHLLLFIRGQLDDVAQVELQTLISKAWQRAAVAAGFSEPDQRIGCNLVVGVTVQERLAAYVAKWSREPSPDEKEALSHRQWGAERELSKWHTKKAKGDRLTPFQILDAYACAAGTATRAKLKILWLEYASAMRGSRQLVWSRGLKKALIGLGCEFDDRSDEELAEAVPSEAIEVAVVSVEEWRWLVGFRLAESLIAQLSNAERFHGSIVMRFLAQVRDRREALRLQRNRRCEDPFIFDLPAIPAA